MSRRVAWEDLTNADTAPVPAWVFEPAEHDAASRVRVSALDNLDAEVLEETGDVTDDLVVMAEPSPTIQLAPSLANVESAARIEGALHWPDRWETDRLAQENSMMPQAEALDSVASARRNGAPTAGMIANWSSSRRLPTTLAVCAGLIVVALIGRARSGPLTVARFLPAAAAAPLTTRGGGASKAQGGQSAATDGETGVRPPVGTLNIRTEPAGVPVSVDGRAVGRAPITVELAPGEHRVILTGAAVEQTVAVQPGTTTMLVIPLAGRTQPSTRGGWMEVHGPIDAQVFENGQLIATTSSPRVMLPPGVHHVEVVNASVGFREAHTVDVKPAAVSTLSFEVPEGSMAVNAVPWADVSLDGEALGPTPIGNILVSVGPHEVVFRHPAYGEQRRTVTVPVQGIARLSVDFTKGAP